MKHEQYFNDFLADQVNLNQSRLDTLESRVKTISGLLKDKLDGYRKYSSQGSYAHQTIIKPVQDNDEFDADILVFIRDNDFDPDNFVTNYVDSIYDVFMNNNNYKDKVTRNTRCVTINYAGDFHLDVVPCVEYEGTQYICNRQEKKYEKTDGDGYKSWLIGKNRIVGGNYFRKSTRLLKFLRDHKDNFSVKSILLTTMLGNEIDDNDQDNSDFSNLPTTLKTLSNGLNDYLQDQVDIPTIENPALPEEDFNRHWDDKKYANFRDKFDIYTKRINEAFDEKNHDESIKKWRKIFGDKFGKLRSNGSNAASSVAIPPTVSATKPYAYND